MASGVHQQTARDPHEVLGVPRGADRHQVIRAFQHMVRRGGHPDTGGDAATFHELVRARDTLLAADRRSAQHTTRAAATDAPHSPTGQGRGGGNGAGDEPAAGAPRAAAPAATAQRTRSSSAPPRTSRLATATVVLTLLGPFFWPAAIVVGLVARRRIRRTGLGGGTVVSLILFILCVLTLPVLVRVLSVVAIP